MSADTPPADTTLKHDDDSQWKEALEHYLRSHYDPLGEQLFGGMQEALMLQFDFDQDGKGG